MLVMDFLESKSKQFKILLASFSIALTDFIHNQYLFIVMT